jgi:protein gp37
MGVSIEDERVVHRIDSLRKTGAFIKFLSLEPLIGPLPNLNLQGIDGVIAGGESGPKARPMQVSRVTDIRDQCKQANVPFFFKQWGGVNKKKNGLLLEGKTYDGMPV